MLKLKLFLALIAQVISLHYQSKDHKLLHLDLNPFHKKTELATELAQIKILNQFDMSYLVELKVGSENQSIQLAVDTGSSDFLIPGQNCYTCSSSQFYECESSETCKENKEETYQLAYGDGLVNTHIAYDDIVLGNMVSKHQSFLLVDFAEGEISMSPAILGIGPDNLQQNRHKSLINSLIKGKQIKKNMFSVYLTSNYKFGSKLILGGYDKQFFENPKEQISWFPVRSSYAYTIDFLGIDLNGHFIQLEQQTALLDTGSSAMTFPVNEINKIIDVFEEQFEIHCEIEIESYNPNYGMLNIYTTSSTQLLPDITFKFFNKTFIMKPEDYIYSCYYGLDSDQYICQTKLEAQYNSNFAVVLGAGFMQTFYAIFDKENQKIGIVRSLNQNRILLTMNREEVVAVKEIQKARAEKKFNKKSKVVALGGLMSIPLVLFGLEFMKKKKVIAINKNQMAVAFGGIFLAASFTLCFYLTLKVDLK